MTVLIRSILPDDMSELSALCIEHAAFERSACAPGAHGNALEYALFGESPRVFVWLAEVDGTVAGYASASFEFSTWAAAEYLHMDCLYLREHARRRGIGELLLDAVCNFARTTGCRTLQWQTPEWNVDAARFYRRIGADEVIKRRFFLNV